MSPPAVSTRHRVPSPDPLIQEFRTARRNTALAVLEGFHALKHALRFGAQIEKVVATDPNELERLASMLASDLRGQFSAMSTVVAPQLFAELAPQAPRTGVMALAKRRLAEAEEIVKDEKPLPVILLEDPRNLQNMGACVRVAAAANAAGVLTTGHNDPWHPDAIRGSAGLHFALPVARVTEVPVSDRPLVAVDPDGQLLRPQIIPERAILAFGTERYGLSSALRRQADVTIRIPMQAGVSSLNLATSVAVVLYAWRLAL
jgi:RNA methyltransferase, TrmH family